jgi:hypothetical protein
MFAFSQVTVASTHYKSCYPTFAFDPVTGAKTDYAEQGQHPDTVGAECNPPCNIANDPRRICQPSFCKHQSQCRVPSAKDKGNPGDPFPVHYTIRQCNASDIRVQYNLFYEKDGTKDGVIPYGHA